MPVFDHGCIQRRSISDGVYIEKLDRGFLGAHRDTVEDPRKAAGGQKM
jgi:hypothetical protein